MSQWMWLYAVLVEHGLTRPPMHADAETVAQKALSLWTVGSLQAQHTDPSSTTVKLECQLAGELQALLLEYLI